MVKKYVKKIFNILLCIALFLSLFFNIPITRAEDKYIGTTLAEGGLRVRSGPGTKYTQLSMLPLGSVVDMVNIVKVADEGGCSDGWYQIYYASEKTGYVCATYLDVTKKIEENTSGVPRNDYEKSLQEAGFPSTYWAALSALHDKHPNWIFEALNTNLEWQSAVAAESVISVNYIQTSNQGYLSTEPKSFNYLTDTFIVQEAGGWYAPNRKTVAYFLDPRTYLNEKQIFMFEKLSYDPTYQTKEALQGVVGTSSYLNNYFDDFIAAGVESDINPVYLISRVRQETGINGGTATSGNAFTYKGGSYSGLYNLYNIGAYSSESNPVLAGLVWASRTDEKYYLPWNSISKSIKGGAKYIADSYINKGQYTGYLQKFNLIGKNPYSHQYMANIQAPASEAVSTYNAYAKMDMIDNSFKFAIPVFKNMGEKSVLPDPGNPNNHLKDLKVNGATVVGFAHDTFVYNYSVSKSSTTAVVEATKINGNAVVSGTGTITLNEDITPISIQVKAQNGDIQEYKVNIIKTEGADLSVQELVSRVSLKSDGTYLSGLSLGMTATGIKAELAKVSSAASISVKTANGVVKSNEEALATGDVVNIVNGTSRASYTIVIYGDCNGDGKITIVDLLKVQKHLLGYEKLNGAYGKSADVDKNNSIGLTDLLRVQKHLLGYDQIEQ